MIQGVTFMEIFQENQLALNNNKNNKELEQQIARDGLYYPMLMICLFLLGTGATLNGKERIKSYSENKFSLNL